jgi:phosphoenolpyruvate carboxylase
MAAPAKRTVSDAKAKPQAAGKPAATRKTAAAKPADPAGLARDLAAKLLQFEGEQRADPYSNPILRVSLEISRGLAHGQITYADVEALIQHLSVAGFENRAARLSRYIGAADPKANDAEAKRLIRALAFAPGEADKKKAKPIAFEAFKAQVESDVFGFVFTAHPTFSLNGPLIETLAVLATGHERDGKPLSAAARAKRLESMAGVVHRPDENISLAREQELSLIAIANAQEALRRIYDIVFDVALENYPDRWSELTPRLMTIATWVGYDLDGRSDIKWTNIFEKRLRVQVLQLLRLRHHIEAMRGGFPLSEDVRQILDLAESRIALAINEFSDEITVFSASDVADDAAQERVQAISRRMYDGRKLRLVNPNDIVTLLDRAIGFSKQNGAKHQGLTKQLCLMRAELKNFGLGMAHTHVRINSTQIHNAIRKTVDLETSPDDPRFRQSYIHKVTELLDAVTPVSINFGSILAERPSAKRLFMIVAQMLKYVDAETPIRFLIAETESAFTVLTALYYARLFDVADKVEICPLFETELALQNGSRVIEQLLENPHYRAYVQQQGRLCVQTGYSDAGRYLGQTPAAGSIERLKERIARLFAKHDLKDIQLVVFDTHGESTGRGGHPDGFEARLSYLTPPEAMEFFRSAGIRFKQESSFQGGDGYVYFFTPVAAYASVTRVLGHFLRQRDEAAETDPYYQERDFITEFLTTVKTFQTQLMTDPSYGALLSAYGTALMYGTGSRASMRQFDSNNDQARPFQPTQFRAIPHNATLQQMGLFANTIGGVGEAIERDPATFASLYKRSARFRQMIALVRYGLAHSNPQVLRAYVETFDPATWLLRAVQTVSPGRIDDYRRLADALEGMPLHARQTPVFRKLFRDVSLLRKGLAAVDLPDDDAAAEAQKECANVSLLHAIRIALIHEIYWIATLIPSFSSQHAITLEQLVQRILRLDVPWAIDNLKQIFPATMEKVEFKFGEPASYVSDESQDYSVENTKLFQPMAALYEMMRRVSTAIVNRIGFIG